MAPFPTSSAPTASSGPVSGSERSSKISEGGPGSAVGGFGAGRAPRFGPLFSPVKEDFQVHRVSS